MAKDEKPRETLDTNSSNEMRIRIDDEPIYYKYKVVWEILNITLNIVDSGTKWFVTKKEAEIFAKKIKTTIPLDHSADILIYEIDKNELIERIMKSKGRINARRIKRGNKK